ncbi:excisionase family DNA-binding protein [Thermomicrobium sp. 4228-Ro]|uniref:helix-turn-helix domain-containing protein n=1 Tax=Thermomicrobium sp. 4228-Ro TaxID=2993937 RepID=UPI002248FAA6|nr:helix-turn-helix domain-containing protein [Thermomicrobium sp. 4228-Ro]MCX2726099.1 excisionase family DNA-binding protein [Thermomicrobium sp. 4228-Ro]
MDSQTLDYQRVIDEALRLLYSHHYRLMSRLLPRAVEQVQMSDEELMAELRASPLGRVLQRLAAVAQGKLSERRERILENIELVLQLLFWAPGAEDYSVPRSFWESELGRLLSQAKYRAYEPSELVSIGKAAQDLGVTRPTIYRWMDERKLEYVRDEHSGRTFIIRRDVEALRQQLQQSA